MEKPYLYINKEEDLQLIKGTSEDVFYFDFETTGLDPFLLTPLLLGLYIKDKSFYIINLHNVSVEGVQAMLAPFLDNLWIAHNAKYDLSIMLVKYKCMFSNVICTMMQEQVIRNGMKVSNSYEATVVRMQEARELILEMYGVDVPQHKIDKSITVGFIKRNPELPYTDVELNYLYNDLLYLPYVHELQEYLIEKYELQETMRIERPLTSILMRMEVIGLSFDYDKHKRLMHIWEESKITILDEFKANILKLSETTSIIDTPFTVSKKYVNAGLSMFNSGEMYSKKLILKELNFSSQKHIIQLLNRTGINIIDTKLTTLETYLKLHNRTPGTILIEILLKYRTTEKLITTYGYSFADNQHEVTGKLHPKYSQTFTVTGRLSSNDFNIQNVPKQVRGCFKSSSKDRLLVTCDLSGQELRIAASQSQDKTVLANFNDGLDLHSILAQASYRIIKGDENFVVNKKSNGDLRDKHKAVTFGWLYGAGYMRIMAVLDVVEHHAKSVLSSIQNIMSDLYYYQLQQKKNASSLEMLRDGSFSNRLKWIRHPYCPLKETYKLEKEAVNFPIQSTGASMIKLAMVLISRHIKENKLNWELLISVHDELLVEVDAENAEENGQIIKGIMEKAGNYFLDGLEMESSCNILEYWEK